MKLIKIIRNTSLKTEYEYLYALRSLRVFNRKEEKLRYKNIRKKLVDLVQKYELIHWSDLSSITNFQIVKSNILGIIVNIEFKFVKL